MADFPVYPEVDEGGGIVQEYAPFVFGGVMLIAAFAFAGNYMGQNANAHSERDTHNAFVSHWRQEPPPNLVDVGAVLIEMKQRNDPWETARPYFECLFRTLDPLARPGHGGI